MNFPLIYLFLYSPHFSTSSFTSFYPYLHFPSFSESVFLFPFPKNSIRLILVDITTLLSRFFFHHTVNTVPTVLLIIFFHGIRKNSNSFVSIPSVISISKFACAYLVIHFSFLFHSSSSPLLRHANRLFFLLYFSQD